MAKRARSATSKGLGDINPQYLTAFATAGAVDDYVIKQLNLPVARIGGSKTKAVVFEILSIDWYLAIDSIESGPFSPHETYQGFFSTGT